MSTLLSRLIAPRSSMVARHLSVKRMLFMDYRDIKLTPKQYQPPPKFTADYDYDTKGECLGRPLSPHLSIYKAGLHMMLSMGHRVTGVISAISVSSLGFSFLVFPDFFVILTDIMPSPIWYLWKLSIAGPMCYHYFNGIRFLVFNTGRFLTVKEVRITGIVTLCVSAVFALLITFINVFVGSREEEEVNDD